MTFTGGSVAMLVYDSSLVLFGFDLAELDAEMASNRSSILEV
jgi:hypothetical protein